MKVEYTTNNGKFKVQFDAENQQDLWKQLAQFQEIFEDLTCTKKVDGKYLKSEKVRFVVRQVDDNEFFELRCTEPGPLFGLKKTFGCFKNEGKGNLFPHRYFKDDKGKDIKDQPLPDNGWVRYNKETGKEE